MDVAGLLDDIKERVRTRGATPFVGGGMQGSFLRGLLGLDPAEEATQAQVRAYQTGQALSNSPTPLALAAAPAAIAKAGKAAKAKKPLPREEALETARKNAVEMLGLPESNTAMDRARAMGFEIGWAHGSPRNDITALRSSRIGAQGPGAYATNYLPEASTYSQAKEGATVYPLMVRRSEALVTGKNNPYDELAVKADDELISELFGRGKSAVITTQEKTPNWLLKAGAPDMPERQHFVSVKPENFRSRFAAFDPKRINDPDLLASLAAFGVGLPVLGLLAEEE